MIFSAMAMRGFYKLQSLYGLLADVGRGRWRRRSPRRALLLAGDGGVRRLVVAQQAGFLALKCAGLCAASLLATPYLYSLRLSRSSPVAIAFLWRARPFDRARNHPAASCPSCAIAGFMISASADGILVAALARAWRDRPPRDPALLSEQRLNPSRRNALFARKARKVTARSRLENLRPSSSRIRR